MACLLQAPTAVLSQRASRDGLARRAQRADARDEPEARHGWPWRFLDLRKVLQGYVDDAMAIQLAWRVSRGQHPPLRARGTLARMLDCADDSALQDVGVTQDADLRRPPSRSAKIG